MTPSSEQTPPISRPRIVDWVFGIPFLIAFGSLLIIFDPIQRIARLFGQRPQEIAVGVLQRLLVLSFKLAGTSLTVEKSAKIQPGKPYIVISNHQSMLDIPIFGGLLFSHFPKYVSKKSLASGIPSISYNLRVGGNALIDRGDRAQAQEAIRELGKRAQERGVTAVIYPEGTRSRTGELGPFKPGGTITLLEAAPDLEIVTATIDGSWRLLLHNLLPVPFGVKLRVKFGDPVERNPDTTPSEILDTCHATIAETLQRWRNESR